jgi:hypothetical protein
MVAAYDEETARLAADRGEALKLIKDIAKGAPILREKAAIDVLSEAVYRLADLLETAT